MSGTSSRSARTPLLKAIQRAFGTVLKSKKSGIPPNELPEWEKHHLTRRKFIETTGKATLITAITGSSFLASCTGNHKPVVVVVGGGIAGLSAAYTLKKAGIFAEIYEASPRTGGRMFTATDIMGKGLTTELGGEFIDSSHADLFNYIKEFELPVIDTQIESEKSLTHAVYYFNGKILSDNDILELIAPYVQRIQQDIDSLSEVVSCSSPSADDKRLDAISIAQYFTSIGISGTLYQLLDVAYTTEYGLDIQDQSAINFLVLIDPGMKNEFNYSGYSDERYKVRGGNQLIPDAIAQRLPYQIHTGFSLTAIRTKNEGKKIVLYFSQAGGATKEVEADFAIITVPFTLLRDVELDYPMAPKQQQAIRELGYGRNAKLFIGFHSAFWRKSGYTGFAFSDTDLQNGWDNSQLQNSVEAGYTIFTGGKGSEWLATGSDAEHAALFLPKMELFFPGAVAAHNKNASGFYWPGYAYAKASYTCLKPGQYTAFGGAQSEPAGNLYFAGEHCSYEFQGFMNGAAQTGRLAAEDILKRLG